MHHDRSRCGNEIRNQRYGGQHDVLGRCEIYKYGKAVSAAKWQNVNEKKKKSIDLDLTSMAHKITKNYGKVKPV